MPLIFIFVVGATVALVRRRLQGDPADRARRGDAAARLLAGRAACWPHSATSGARR